MNNSNLYSLVYTYLGYRDISPDEAIDQLIFECLEEIKEIASFSYRYMEYDQLLDFLKKEQYLKYLNGSTRYLLCAMTLGARVDHRVRYYEKTNLVKMCVFDAVASAYLEEKSDEFERSLNYNLGYRFCPGYQNTPLEDVRKIHSLLHAEKMGISILDSNLMVPQKSMVGIVGIDNHQQKSCTECAVASKCVFKKEGRVCYTK